MRGADGMQESLFTFAMLDAVVPADHSLRKLTMTREIVLKYPSLR